MMTVIKVSAQDKVFDLEPFQRPFVLSKARHPAYVAAWGTGKSLTGIGRAMTLSQRYPGNLGVIFRKEFVDLETSTIKDFQDYTGIKVNSRQSVKVFDSEIMFLHIEELNNIQNINLGWFWIEQAEELLTDIEFFTLFGRLRRKNCGVQSGFITANTCGHNWIYKLWKCGLLEKKIEELRAEMPELFEGLEPGFKMSELFEAKTHDNKKNLSSTFLLGLEVMRKTKPNLYNRFVLNSWEDVDTVDQIILPAWIEKAYKKDVLIRPPVRKIVSVDVARYGDDKTVFREIIHSDDKFKVGRRATRSKENTMETAGWATKYAAEWGANAFAVDEIGVGAGVYDRLVELKKEVVAINSSLQASNPAKYSNRRAEIYSYAAEAFQEGRVELDEDDTDAVEQLSWARYKAIKSTGKLQVEAKEDIKKRYGRSPDDADAVVGGIWAVPQTSVAVSKSKAERGNAVRVYGNADTV